MFLLWFVQTSVSESQSSEDVLLSSCTEFTHCR